MASRPGGSTGPGRGNPGRRGSQATARSAARPEPTGSGGSRFTTRAVVLVIVMLLLIASYTSSLRTWWQQRQEISSTEAEIVMRKEAIADLEDDAKRWDDPAYVQQQARERFGWVLPGEVGYRVIDSDGVVEGNVPQLAEPPSPEAPQWYEQLWSSVQTSGEDPVERAEEESVPDEVLQEGQ